MTITNRNLLSSALAIALASAAGCAGQVTDDVFAPLESGEANELSMEGPARYTAAWARQLFPSKAGFYLYQDAEMVTGAVFFSDLEVCQFQDISIFESRFSVFSDHCSGAIEGGTLELRCKERASGDFACSGTLVAPQGETDTGTVISELDYEDAEPHEPLQDVKDEHWNCPGSQSPCGPTGCCAEFQRCGSGQCYDRADI